MHINKNISRFNFYPGTIDRLKAGYIVIHYVGALGSAKQNCDYYAGGNRGASAHYFVDHGGDIWQSVEDKNSAWHCGANTYKHPKCRNTNSIGIELCCRTKGDVSKADGNWYFEDATVASAIELTKELMAKYNIPADHVIRHYDVTGKTCPAPYVFNTGKHTWDEFKAAIQTPGKVSAPATPQTSTDSKKNESTSFTVRVNISDLNIRKGPGTNYPKESKPIEKGVYTIVETSEGPGSKAGWGLLKSGQANRDRWISLSPDYVTRL